MRVLLLIALFATPVFADNVFEQKLEKSYTSDLRVSNTSVKASKESYGSMIKPIKTIKVYQEVSVSNEAEVKLIEEILCKVKQLLEMRSNVDANFKMVVE